MRLLVSSANMSERTKSVDRLRSKWITAVNDGSAIDYLSVLSDKVVWFPPNGEAINGKDEFRSWIEPFMNEFDYEFSVSDYTVNVIGSWALEHGSFISKLRPKRGGETLEHVGTYFIFLASADG